MRFSTICQTSKGVKQKPPDLVEELRKHLLFDTVLLRILRALEMVA